MGDSDWLSSLGGIVDSIGKALPAVTQGVKSVVTAVQGGEHGGEPSGGGATASKPIDPTWLAIGAGVLLMVLKR